MIRAHNLGHNKCPWKCTQEVGTDENVVDPPPHIPFPSPRLQIPPSIVTWLFVEVAKSIYVRDFFYIPLATSLPILITERITDMIVMAVLASIGFLLLGETPDLIVAGIIFLGIILVFVLRTPILDYVSRRGLPGFLVRRGFDQMLNQASLSQTALFTRRGLIPNIVLGSIAWMFSSSRHTFLHPLQPPQQWSIGSNFQVH